VSNDLQIFKGNTIPLTVKVYYKNDINVSDFTKTVNLTGSTVAFVIKDGLSGTQYLSKSMTVQSQSAHRGYLTTTLTSGDTDIAAGTYIYEITINMGGSPEEIYTVVQDSIVIRERI